MMSSDEKLNLLRDRIKLLQNEQQKFQEEISSILKEIETLSAAIQGQNSTSQINVVAEKAEPTPIVEVEQPKQEEPSIPKSERLSETLIEESPKEILAKRPEKTAMKTVEWEKFIGENLTNKIGILILILGIAIGTKYSIDNNLITPGARIILGYVLSGVMAFFAFRTFAKYFNLSAALVSGAIAGFYLVSYAAFASFHFFSQGLAFFLLIVSVIASVYVAMLYKRQVIALFGLVGAYAAPFLVSTGSNNVTLLFVYIAVLNAAILYLAYKQNWRLVTYSSFVFTWLIFLGWFIFAHSDWSNDSIGMVFSTVFYLLFHLFFLISRTFKDKTGFKAIGLLVINSIVFYLVFLDILENYKYDNDFMGTFTFVFAVINALSAYFIYKRNAEDSTGTYLFSGFAILLVLVGIPIQFEGNWVTILYILFATGIFSLGLFLKSKLFNLYAVPTLIVAVLVFFVKNFDFYENSLTALSRSSDAVPLTSVFNTNFLTAIVVCIALIVMNVLNKKKGEEEYANVSQSIMEISQFVLPGFLLFTIFYMVNAEISYFWDVKYILSGYNEIGEYIGNQDYALTKFKYMWQLNWALLFNAVFLFINANYWKNDKRNVLSLVTSGVVVVAFMITGLWTLSDIREMYMLKTSPENVSNLGDVVFIRYVSLGFLALLGVMLYLNRKKGVYAKEIKYILEIVMHVVLFWVISSEMLHWMELAGRASAYKTGLSLTAGLYAIFLIILGIWKKRPYLRIMAFILFGLTLVKLFFYDISNMSRIAKTVVFILLGGMLLLISFLYNKYKQKMENDQEKKE